MALTFGITGMDSETEAEMQAAFKIANTEAGHRWALVDAGAADYVVIDMDSLYGPMSWMRSHSVGQKVIGLTEREHSQTDYRLPRPLHSSDLAVLLCDIANDTPAAAAPDTHAEIALSTPESAPAPEPAPQPAPEPSPVVEIAPAPVPTPEPPPVVETAPAPEPIPAPAPQGRLLAAWLASNGPNQRLRLQRDNGPILLIDTGAHVWHGPATLKPLTAYFGHDLLPADFNTPDDAAWATEAAALGPAQPLARLHWLGGLLSKAPTDGQYLLNKWPQTEREYPKHFRIATAMMKGPANVTEIAEASHVSAEEVVDFINANLATGYAEHATSTPPPSDSDAPKTSGLFGRLRGH